MEPLFIIKIGGNVIDSPAELAGFLQAFALLRGKKILVHGGGKLATTLAEKTGVPQQLVDGRRITDAETLKIVTMVYAGLINKTIVTQLQAAGCPALGLTGADGNAIRAHRRQHPQHDFGFVGDIETVNTELLERFLQDGLALVMAPLTHDGEGQLLNTNADTIAQSLAAALAAQYAVRLIYSFEKKGVLLDTSNDSSVITLLTPGYYADLKAEGRIFAGMLPKLDNAFAAVGQGVKEVLIGPAAELQAMTEGKAGTRITHE